MRFNGSEVFAKIDWFRNRGKEESVSMTGQAKKLSDLAGIDKALFKDRKPSKDLELTRKEWTDEFDERLRTM